MCGIVGVAGNLSLKEESVFSDLLIVDAIRGKDSTGLISVPCDPSLTVKYVKQLGNPHILLASEMAKELLTRKHTCLIGHNRSATVGDVIVANAHPFKYDHIMGVHNGTLVWKSLLPDWKDFDVDSANIFYAIAKEGVKETVEKLDGAYALAWFDSNEWSLNFIRNDQRPLFYVISEDKNKIYWASEAYMLHLVLNRHSIKIPKVCLLPIDTHFKFTFPKDEKLPLNGPYRETMEGYTYTTLDWGLGAWIPGHESRYEKQKRKQSSRTGPPFALIQGGKEKISREKDLPWEEASREMDAEYASRLCEYSYQGTVEEKGAPEVDKQRVVRSCDFCDNTLVEEDPWYPIGEDSLLCIECYTDMDVRECFDLDMLSEEEVDNEWNKPSAPERRQKSKQLISENLKDIAIRLRKSNQKNRKKKLKRLKKILTAEEHKAVTQLLETKGVIK